MLKIKSMIITKIVKLLSSLHRPLLFVSNFILNNQPLLPGSVVWKRTSVSDLMFKKVDLKVNTLEVQSLH